MLFYNFENRIFVQRNLDWDKDEDLSNQSSLIKNLNEKLKTNNVLEQLKPIFGAYLQRGCVLANLAEEEVVYLLDQREWSILVNFRRNAEQVKLVAPLGNCVSWDTSVEQRSKILKTWLFIIPFW